MKILVVEDDGAKLRNIVAALVEIDGVSLKDISHVGDAVGAKRFLHETNVDLIVLDLHLPDRIDLPPQPAGGLEFMRSIASRPSFFVPPHVIAMTGNADALAIPGEDVGELWGIIRYDASDCRWREQLGNRIRYALAAWQSMLGRPRETRPCDIAIITALNDELDGLLKQQLGWTEHRFEGDSTIYHEGYIENNEGAFRVVAATAGRMGMAATAALSSKIIDLYRPTWIAMAGITGGIRGRVALGDVLVADPSWDWGSGKYEVVNGEPRFAANPDQLRISPDIRPLLLSASNNKAMLTKLRSSFAGTSPGHPLECYVEAVASGASVLGDEAVVEAIKSQNRKLHGVEMEIYGLMMAAETCARPRPIAFSAKAVSDFADTTKDDDCRAYAIHVSTNFVVEFVRNYLKPSVDIS
jgi:nucleoside phosphorylase/CheY-like chemotaxis protein